MPQPRYRGNVVRLSPTRYFVGAGVNDDGLPLPALVYDFETDAWTELVRHG